MLDIFIGAIKAFAEIGYVYLSWYSYVAVAFGLWFELEQELSKRR